MACTVAVPDQFNSDLVARRAAYIAFRQAVPKNPAPGASPCIFTCPAGIKAHGYVSLTHGAEYEKAFNLILETPPQTGRALVYGPEVPGTPAEIPGALPGVGSRCQRGVQLWRCQRLGCARSPPRRASWSGRRDRRSRPDGPVRSMNDRKARNRLTR